MPSAMKPVPSCIRKVKVVLKLLTVTRLVVNTLPASPNPPSVSRATAGGSGAGIPVTVTWSKVAVARVPSLWAVSARPTYTVLGMTVVCGSFWLIRFHLPGLPLLSTAQ